MIFFNEMKDSQYNIFASIPQMLKMKNLLLSLRYDSCIFNLGMAFHLFVCSIINGAHNWFR